MSKEQREVESHQKEKISNESNNGELDKKISIALDKVNKANFDRELKSIFETKQKKGKAASIFLLKDKVIGSKKVRSEPVMIEDPEAGIPIDTPEGIKSVSLEYCTKLLTNREPKPSFQHIAGMK